MIDGILIVEDDADDAHLIRRALLSLHPKAPVRIVNTGAELKAYLEGRSRFANRDTYPYPALILLDLKMPEMNGFEVMEWLKKRPQHAAIPVIVISSYDQQKYIKQSYQLGALTFISKPVDPEHIRDAIRTLKLPIEFAD